MTFEEYLQCSDSITFRGNELVGLYLILVEMEETMDAAQLAGFERLRISLYSNFSVEQMETLPDLYQLKGTGSRF